jgi:hypothetical protein
VCLWKEHRSVEFYKNMVALVSVLAVTFLQLDNLLQHG